MRIAFFLFIAAVCFTISACRDSQRQSATKFVKRAKVTVAPSVLDDYTGSYQLPSGALFHVFRDRKRLMGGCPPYELLPQTTREFASNRIFAQLIFERDDLQSVKRLNFRIAKRDLWIDRVDPNKVVDPTQMIDAGGHRLRALIAGTGSPVVVIEDGFGSSIEMRAELQSELAKFTRVVAYDHAGTGGSEAGPQPRNARQVAKELRTMLKNADLKPPFILVGGSIGGDYMRVFAHRYPRDVGGMVLLDPTPDWDDLEHWTRSNSPEQIASFLKMKDLANRSATEMMKYQEPGRADEWAAIDQTRIQARLQARLQASAAASPPNAPIVQITGAAGRSTRKQARDKVEFFAWWLKQNLPSAKHVLAEQSGHAIFAADAELVLREIREMIMSVREERVIPDSTARGFFREATPFPRGFHRDRRADGDHRAKQRRR